jgi:hypothetical protein
LIQYGGTQRPVGQSHQLFEMAGAAGLFTASAALHRREEQRRPDADDIAMATSNSTSNPAGRGPRFSRDLPRKTWRRTFGSKLGRPGTNRKSAFFFWKFFQT